MADQSAGRAIGVLLQRMGYREQALSLARFACARSEEGQFTPKGLQSVFQEFSMPPPERVQNIITELRRMKYLTPGDRRGSWKITPLGREASIELFSELDLAAFVAESANSRSVLGQVSHSVIPPSLAPPELITGLRKFLAAHPFERNVFGMTRFPDEGDSVVGPDPVGPALTVAREVCLQHGLEFHLASDRAIHDDLWTNTAGHMWASRYGIGFFENRRKEGLNYNLTIEVGSMLMTGRRCALLKDASIERMPTDLVGRIYKSVNLDDLKSVREALHQWIRDDLGLGECPCASTNKWSDMLLASPYTFAMNVIQYATTRRTHQ
jgi:hypothetical protein